MSVSDHKCNKCSAELKFDPKSQKWICHYCGSIYEKEDLKSVEKEKDGEKHIVKESSNISFNGYYCPDCGAEIILNENTSATHCVYCGNIAIINERLEKNFAPEKIIPFKKTKEEVYEVFMKYKKGKWFMPKEFLNKKNIEKISGIYIPFYLYDIDVDAQIEVEARNIKTWSDRQYKYTRIESFMAYRSGKISFEKIPTDASKKFSDDIMDSIEPYDYRELKEFDISYLSGFLAEKYDLNKDELYKRASVRAKESAIQYLFNDVRGYDEKIIKKRSESTKIIEQSQYVLLPVWMLNVQYKDKLYTLAMNGQTGKFIGNVPISWKRIIKYWFSIFVGISIIGILLNLLAILDFLN